MKNGVIEGGFVRKNFVFALFLIVLGGLFSAPSFAHDSDECEKRLKVAATFPNGEYKLDQGQFQRKALPIDAKYENALKSLPAEIEAVPLSYFTGGQYKMNSIEQLVGRAIVGVNLRHHQADGTRDFQYISGRITSAEVLKDLGYDQLRLSVETASGKKELELPLHFFGWPGQPEFNQVFILDNKKSEEERIRDAFQYVNFPKVIEDSFGEPATAQDFAVASAAVETYLSLPASWGIPGTIKTLRGLHDKTKEHKNFGVVADNKRYGPKALTQFLSAAENFMKNLQLINKEQVESEDSLKENLFIKRPRTSVVTFVDLLAGLQTPGASQLNAADSSRVTAADLAAAASQRINIELTTKMTEQFFGVLIKNQKRIHPQVDGKPARVEESKLLRGRETQRQKPFPVIQMSKKRTAAGPLITYRIDAGKFVQITVASIWLDIDPVVEVQFKENSSDILSMYYFWRLSMRSKGELFAAPELAGKSEAITTDFSQFDQAITSVLKQ